MFKKKVVVVVITLLAGLLILSGLFWLSQKRVVISGLKAEQVKAQFALSLNENYSRQPVSIAKRQYEQTILAHAPSLLYFRTKGRYNFFRAEVGLDDGVGLKGEVRFLIYLDDQLSYISEVCRGGDAPLSLLIDLKKAQTVALVVDDYGQDLYDQAIWANPEFLREQPADLALSTTDFAKWGDPKILQGLPLGWHLSSPFANNLKVQQNRIWDTGPQAFPNRFGLLVWQLLAGFFYFCLFIVFWPKREYLKAKLSAWRRYNVTTQGYILGLTALLMLLVLLPLMRSGLPASWDAGQHYYRTWVMKNLFLSNFQLDGWSPYWYLGVQQFLFYSPFVYVSICLFHFLSFQLLPLAVCFKLFYLAAYFCLPFACFWLLRQFKIAPIASALAALGVPAFSTIYGLGLEGLFVTGLFSQAFSLIIFVITLGCLKRLLDQGSRKNMLSFGLWLGVLFTTHMFSSIFFLFCLAFFVLFYANDNKFILRLFPVSFIALSIGAFSLLPFIYFYFQGLSGPETGWGRINLLWLIVLGNILGPSSINLAGLFGLGLAFFKKQKDFVIIALLVLLTYFLSYEQAGPVLNYFKFLPSQLFQARSYVFIGLFLIMLSGYAYQQIISWFELDGQVKTRTIIYALIVLVGFSTCLKLWLIKDLVKVEAHFSGVERQGHLKAFAWLKKHTPENIVVAFDDRSNTIGSLGFNQFVSQINTKANRYTLDGNQMELSHVHNEDVERHLADWTPEKLFERFKRYNVSYVYTWNEDAMKNLAQGKDYFSPVYYNGVVSIWQVLQHDFRYLANDNVKIKKFYFAPEQVVWQVLNQQDDKRVVASIAYHPNWQAKINNQVVKIIKTNDNLLSVQLPQKNTLYQIELKFERAYWEKILVLLALLSFGLVAFFLYRELKLKEG